MPYYVFQAEKELDLVGKRTKITLYFVTVSEILTNETEYLRIFEVETEESLGSYIRSSIADVGHEGIDLNTDLLGKPSFLICLRLSPPGDSGNSTETNCPMIYYYLMDTRTHRIGSLHAFCFKDHRIGRFSFLPSQVTQCYGV